jgi:inosose dehydratase
MASTGFEGTEFGDWGFLPTNPRDLTALLERNKLQLAGAFVPVALAERSAHEGGVDLALRTARLLAECGTEAVVVLADGNGSDPQRTACAGRIREADMLPRESWDCFVEGVTRIASEVRAQTGIMTVFHHHCAGYVETPSEVDYLLTHTEPDLLGLCLDTGHFAFGGGDPLAALQRYGDRVRHVHFKDCSQTVARTSREEQLDYFESLRRGIFCELGKGNVDFSAILRHLEERNYQGWVVVEQDVLPGMGSPLENARRNRAYLRSIGL